jgi:hypothetical protein
VEPLLEAVRLEQAYLEEVRCVIPLSFSLSPLLSFPPPSSSFLYENGCDSDWV